MAQSLNQISESGNFKNILEVAGNRFSAACLLKFLEPESLKQTPKGFDIEIDDWSSLEFSDSKFDLVVLTEVIEHLSADPAKVIFEANKALKMDGELFISTPNIGSATGLYNLAHGHSPYHWGGLTGERGDRHQREYAKSELEFLVAAQGFPKFHLLLLLSLFMCPAQLVQCLRIPAN